jgi:hypothetical protein
MNDASAKVTEVQTPHAPKRRTIPDELWKDSEWSAALHIGVTVFGNDGRFWSYVNMPGESRRQYTGIDFKTMLAESSWSSGEQLMAELAANLFNSSCDVQLSRMCMLLGDRLWRVALEAIGLRRRDPHLLDLVIGKAAHVESNELTPAAGARA